MISWGENNAYVIPNHSEIYVSTYSVIEPNLETI